MTKRCPKAPRAPRGRKPAPSPPKRKSKQKTAAEEEKKAEEKRQDMIKHLSDHLMQPVDPNSSTNSSIPHGPLIPTLHYLPHTPQGTSASTSVLTPTTPSSSETVKKRAAPTRDPHEWTRVSESDDTSNKSSNDLKETKGTESSMENSDKAHKKQVVDKAQNDFAGSSSNVLKEPTVIVKAVNQTCDALESNTPDSKGRIDQSSSSGPKTTTEAIEDITRGLRNYSTNDSASGPANGRISETTYSQPPTATSTDAHGVTGGSKEQSTDSRASKNSQEKDANGEKLQSKVETPIKKGTSAGAYDDKLRDILINSKYLSPDYKPPPSRKATVHNFRHVGIGRQRSGATLNPQAAEILKDTGIKDKELRSSIKAPINGNTRLAPASGAEAANSPPSYAPPKRPSSLCGHTDEAPHPPMCPHPQVTASPPPPPPGDVPAPTQKVNRPLTVEKRDAISHLIQSAMERAESDNQTKAPSATSGSGSSKPTVSAIEHYALEELQALLDEANNEDKVLNELKELGEDEIERELLNEIDACSDDTKRLLAKTFVVQQLVHLMGDKLSAARRENAILRFRHKLMNEGYRPEHMNNPHLMPMLQMDDQYKAYCQRMMQMATQSPSTSMPPGPQPGPSHLTSTSVTPSRIPTSLRESNLRNYANDSPSTPNGRVRSAKDTTNGNGPSYPRVSLGSEKPPKSGVSIDVNDGKYAVSKLADVTKKDYTIETPTRRKNAGQKSTVFGDPSLLTGGCTTAKSSEPAKLDETPIVGKFDFYDPTPVLNKAEALRQQMELALRQIQQGGESDEMEAEEAESQTNQTQMQHAESPANKQKKKIEKKSGFESYFDYELSKKEPKAKESASGTRNENKPSTSYRYVPDDVFGEGLGEQKAASSLEIHVPAAIKPAESTTVAPPSLETFGSATWAKAKLFSASNEADLIAKNLELAASLSEQVTSLSERNATMAHKNDTVPQTESATDIKATPAHAPELKTPSAKGKERAKPAEDNESPTSHTLTPDNGITLCLPIPIGLAESNLQQHTDDPTCAPGGENTPPGPAAPFIGPPRPPSEPQSSQVLQSGRSTPNPEADFDMTPHFYFDQLDPNNVVFYEFRPEGLVRVYPHSFF